MSETSINESLTGEWTINNLSDITTIDTFTPTPVQTFGSNNTHIPTISPSFMFTPNTPTPNSVNINGNNINSPEKLKINIQLLDECIVKNLSNEFVNTNNNKDK
tara:strand:- start:198 stop:509 length:312 start_codon:yes stop_codon:yes gene_type:complete